MDKRLRLPPALAVLRTRQRIGLAVAFCMVTALGIGLRMAWIIHVPTQQLFDFATFIETATNIYEGNGHSLNRQAIAWVGCGYSYALAFFFKLMGSADPFNAKILNVWLSSISLITAFFLFIKLFGSRRQTPDGETTFVTHWPSVWAAYGLTAVFPNLIAYNNVAGTESFFLFILTTLLALQLYPLRQPFTAVTYCLMGVLTGMAALTKPFMLAYPVILLVIHWVDTKDIRQCVKFLLLTAIPCLLVIAPWTYRNYRLFGQFIPVSYNMGYNRLVNNNERNITGTWMPLEAVDLPEAVQAQINESLLHGRTIKQAYELEPILAAEAGQWIRAHPLAFVQLGVMRLQKTYFAGADDIGGWAMNDWNYDEGGPTEYTDKRHTAFAQSLFTIMVTVVTTAGFLFLCLRVGRYARTCFTAKRVIAAGENLVFLNIAFFMVIVFTFEGQQRYNHPVLLFFIYALVWLCERALRGSRAAD